MVMNSTSLKVWISLVSQSPTKRSTSELYSPSNSIHTILSLSNCKVCSRIVFAAWFVLHALFLVHMVNTMHMVKWTSMLAILGNSDPFPALDSDDGEGGKEELWSNELVIDDRLLVSKETMLFYFTNMLSLSISKTKLAVRGTQNMTYILNWSCSP